MDFNRSNRFVLADLIDEMIVSSLLFEGGGEEDFAVLPRRSFSLPFLVAPTTIVLLLLSSFFTNTRHFWTGIFCLTNRRISVYHISKPLMVFEWWLRPKKHHSSSFLKKLRPIRGFFFAITSIVLAFFIPIVNLDRILILCLPLQQTDLFL